MVGGTGVGEPTGVAPLPLFTSFSGYRKDEVQRVIPAGWRQAGPIK